ncbi:recombinase family protein [Sphingomonas sp. UYEF23]|uniref:recombinase family protein n=1 Tax=Sphingomonas sp. UYEF23 TaxID=1756408 RepID=UPI003399D499
MIYGYARVSSSGQDLAQQLAQLDAAGCTKVYREKISGATAERPQLKRAIGALDAGDVLMVTSTDRLARNTRDLLNILHAVKEAGAGFRSIAEPMVDTTSQLADVIIAVLGVAASYERHRITERTAAGRVQAKARGVKFGRRTALTPHQQSEALQRLAAGDTQRTVAALLGVSQATISRIATPTVQRTARALSPSTEAWSQATLDAGNRADHDPEYAYEIGKRLF